MKKKIQQVAHKFSNNLEGDEHEMTISGAIGQGGWFYDATSAKDVRSALDGVTASTIRLKLNSGGGDAFDGIEIYNYLKDHKAHVIVEVTALAASAASIIAMGADEIIMRTGSNLMIHEAATFAYGTKGDIQKTMNALETIDDSIVSIYKQRTGLSSEEIKKMIEAETWLTAEEALEKGFVDSIETVEDPKGQEKNNFPQNAKVNINFTNEQIDSIVAKVTANLQKNKNQTNEPAPVAKKRGFIF
ncbi:head maturation protease, ClpP-related [Peribacillus sp. TH14]|uniref:head maturation protease, ClpP-related n=1 Tax=Peribacillus sp. TH14 TaxID=2798481 RepID=UPI001911FBC8|nr:head maturation protease, ClpP-related [Peribacillus sp. TH14]MBK5497420.1 Clp protease ClpP [Peribacillus sp. TH14]